MAFDNANNVYISGYTYSNDFPVMNGYQTANISGVAGFVSKKDQIAQRSLHLVGDHVKFFVHKFVHSNWSRRLSPRFHTLTSETTVAI